MRTRTFLHGQQRRGRFRSNVALCVNPDVDYCKVHAADGKTYYLAQALLDSVLGTLAAEDKPAYEIVEHFKGSELEYREYEPLFPFVKPVCQKQGKRVII